jgi:hypothetical protein
MEKHAVNKLTHPMDEFEARLLDRARRFAYPPAPDVTAAVTVSVMHGTSVGRKGSRRSARRLSFAIIALMIAISLAVTMTVPTVRAALLEWIRSGAVQIYLIQPSPSPTPTLRPGTSIPTFSPSVTPLASALDLAGETSLAEARERAGFPILLPSYPTDLGQPQHIFLQELDVPSVVLVWMNAAQPNEIRFSLSQTPSGSVVLQKMAPQEVANTFVNGQPAYWVTSPYVLVDRRGDWDVTRLISSGHTLIWTAGDMTYRLESELELAEAVRLAESLR